MPHRPCLGFKDQRCNKLTPKSRCPDHQRLYERNRPPRPTTLTRDAAERQRRKHTVDNHIEQHGMVCPGWDVPPHPVIAPNILTADHITAVAEGGPGGGPLHVLCRVCNGRKDAQTRQR